MSHSVCLCGTSLSRALDLHLSGSYSGILQDIFKIARMPSGCLQDDSEHSERIK